MRLGTKEEGEENRKGGGKKKPDHLPRSLGQKPLRPAPDPSPPQLVNQNNKQAKSKWQEPVLYRHARSAKHILNRGNVQPNGSHAQREQDGGEQVPVGRLLVEQRRVLQDAQAARSRGHEIEPLHDYQVDKVDGRRLVQLRGVVVRVDVGGDDAEAEPQVRERNAIALEIPEGHGKRGQGLGDTNDGVGVEDELPVNEAVLLDISGSAEEDVRLGLFVGQDGGRGAVGETTVKVLVWPSHSFPMTESMPIASFYRRGKHIPNYDHEERRQNLR